MATTTEERKIKIILDGQQVNASLKQMEAAQKLMNNQLKKMSEDDPKRKQLLKDFQEMRGRVKDAKDEIYGIQKASLAAKLGLDGMGGILKTVVGTAGGLLLGGGLQNMLGGIGSLFKSASDTAKEFEKSLNSLAAITQLELGSEDLKFYEEQAARIGQTTTLSASQAVEAFQLIGGAKAELLENKEALVGVTEQAIILAEAAGIDLPDAAQALVGSLNQFQIPAEEAGRLINALAAGSTAGAAEIPQISESIDKFGVAAASFNVTFEESVALVETLAEYNMKGAESGTALRNVLGKMASVKALPASALEELERFGVNLDVVSDTTIPLNERLTEFSKISGDATALTKVFGLENKVAGEILLTNVDKFSDLTKAVTGTSVAMEQQAKNTDNLDGDFKALGSATESLQISIGQGLNIAVREGVQLLTKLVLAVKEAPAFFRENQDVIYTLGAAILALNAGNIRAAASTLAHNAAEKGRAIATKASAAAQWVLNAAMNANPIGAVIALVAGLVGGFVILYNRSEAVRGGIAGLWEGFKELLSIAGDVALFLINPIKNASKIKDIMNAGDRLGKAFSDGYNAKIASEKEKQEEKEVVEHEKAKEKATQKGQELGKATADGFAASLKGKSVGELEAMLESETDAAHKKLIQKQIKHLKEVEKNEKKSQEELKKAREKYNDAVIKSEDELEKLRIDVRLTGVERDVAMLKLKHDRELRELEKHRQDILANAAITEDEKAALLAQYEEQRQLKEEEFEAAKAEKQKAKQEEDLEKWFERLEEEEALKAAALEEQYLNTLIAEFEHDQALLELKKGTMQQKLDLIKQFGNEESLEAKKLKNEILQTDKEIAEGKVENTKKTVEAKRKLEQAGYDNAKMFLDFGLDLLSQDEAARKKNAEAIKAFTIGKIFVNLAQEISGYMTHEGSVATFGVLGGIKAALATARAFMSAKQVQAQAFAVGGNTLPMVQVGGTWQMASGHSGGSVGAFAAGGDVKSARLGLIGEAGAEWVMPNWMLRSPKYAATYQWLESERQKGISAFATGGPTAMPPVPEVQDNSAQVLAALETINNNIVANSQRVEQWQRELHVNYNAKAATEAMVLLNEMQRKGGF